MAIDSVRLSKKEAESAARGCLVKFDTRRRFLIRCAELSLFPLIQCVNFLRSPRKGPSNTIENILVMEGGQLGDIALLLPFLQNLRLHYPGRRISLLANPKAFSLLENLALVDELISVEIPWIANVARWGKYNPVSSQWVRFVRTVFHLYSRKFDLSLCARADIRDNFLMWLTGAKRRVGYAFYGGDFLLTDTVTPDLDHLHYSSRWLRLLEHLGKQVSNRQPRFQLSREEEIFAKEYLAKLQIGAGDLLIGIHPGARVRTRQWGAENFRALGEKLVAQQPAKILWFQDPNVRTPTGLPSSFVPVTLPLRQFMAVLAHCNFLICNDSGPMHIATALGVPVVAVFGPNKPDWFGPLGEGNKIVINPAFWCRPCGDRCIFDQPYCLRTISVEQVFQAASTLSTGSVPVHSGERS
jgi:heptosyltransferase-2